MNFVEQILLVFFFEHQVVSDGLHGLLYRGRVRFIGVEIHLRRCRGKVYGRTVHAFERFYFVFNARRASGASHLQHGKVLVYGLICCHEI